MPKARPGRNRCQVNVSLDDDHWFLALQQVALRDGRSVPDLLRPVILSFLKRRLASDEQLAAAVASIEKSRSITRDREQRRKKLAPVAELPVAGQRAGGARRAKPNDPKSGSEGSQ